jgi:hypothetical protein
MNRYGQLINWSTPNAPHPFSGICTSWSENDQLTRQLDETESGDQHVLIQHSAKSEISFEAKVTEASTDFLDLSTGGAITIAGVAAGQIIATRCIERWTLGQPKTISLQATRYPDIAAGAANAGVLNAFTPDQSALTFLHPSGKVIYGTYGMTSAAGIIHLLEVSQELQITEDDPSPDGKILGCADHGYLRTLSMDVLTRPATDTIPAKGTVLALTGAPAHLANYRIESVETKFAEKRGEMISFKAVWIPPLG